VLDSFVREPAAARALGQKAAAIVRQRWTLDAATERLEEHLRSVCQRAIGVSEPPRDPPK